MYIYMYVIVEEQLIPLSTLLFIHNINILKLIFCNEQYIHILTMPHTTS